MDNIIITVTDIPKSYLYDIEVPTDIRTDKLKGDIVEVLNGYNPNLSLNSSSIQLLCNRTGKQIMSDETFSEAGIWSGDYITIIEV